MKITIWIRPNEKDEPTMRSDFIFESRDTPAIQRYGRKLLKIFNGEFDGGEQK